MSFIKEMPKAAWIVIGAALCAALAMLIASC
jgi:hypothetical protein